MSLAPFNASLVAASQLAGSSLAHQRFDPDNRVPPVRLQESNVVMWVNPVGGGGRGKKIAATYEQDFRRAKLRICRVNPKNPEQMIHPSTGHNVSVQDYLKQNTTGNVFILETLPGRTERTNRLVQLLTAIHTTISTPPIGLPMGGDGTISEFMEAAWESVGVGPQDLIHARPVSTDQLAQLPLMAAPTQRTGSACDYSSQALSGGSRPPIVKFLEQALPVPMSCSATSIPGKAGEDIFLTPHSTGFGFGAEIFRRGDKAKFGWLKGSSWNYKLRIPLVLSGGLLSWLRNRVLHKIPLLNLIPPFDRPTVNPAASFIVQVQIEGQEAFAAQVQDVLLTGLRYVGGGLYVPSTPLDGVTLLLTRNVIGAVPAAVESQVRASIKQATGDEGDSIFWGNHIRLIPKDHQVALTPGQKVELSFWNLDNETLSEPIPFQFNGEFREKVSEARFTVTTPYPKFLVAPGSRFDQLHNPDLRAARPVVRQGVQAYAVTELTKYLAGPESPLASLAMALSGLVMSRKAPRAAVIGLLLSPLAVVSSWVTTQFQEILDLSDQGLEGFVKFTSGSLGTYLGLAIAIRYLARNHQLRKIIAGDYQPDDSDKKSGRLARFVAAGSSLLLGALHFLSS